MKQLPFKESLIEAIREAFRVIMASTAVIIPFCIQQLEMTGTIDIRLVKVALLVAILKGVDRFVHKYSEIPLNGILPS